jgi:hypothetical protein
MLRPTDIKLIELPRLEIQRLAVTVIGRTPLIVHRFSDKAKKQIYEKQSQRANKGRKAKDPMDDFKSSLYTLPDGRHGFPAVAFKAAAVTACTSLSGVTKVGARQAFHVNGELSSRPGVFEEAVTTEELVPILSGAPSIREDMVRVAMGGTDIRYRAQYWPWAVELDVSYNPAALSAEQVLNLFNVAGFACGVGEWRPERDGQNGQFRVAEDADAKLISGLRKNVPLEAAAA